LESHLKYSSQLNHGEAVIIGMMAASKVSTKLGLLSKAELKKMLRRHSYYGGGIPYGVRLATGDPNIPVIDRRTYGSMSSQCGFITARGKRTMLCQ